MLSATAHLIHEHAHSKAFVQSTRVSDNRRPFMGAAFREGAEVTASVAELRVHPENLDTPRKRLLYLS